MPDKTPAQLRREQRFWELRNDIQRHEGEPDGESGAIGGESGSTSGTDVELPAGFLDHFGLKGMRWGLKSNPDLGENIVEVRDPEFEAFSDWLDEYDNDISLDADERRRIYDYFRGE